MQAEPPPPPEMPTIDLGPVPLIPIPQEFDVGKGQVGGKPVVFLTFRSPLTATAVVLGREAANVLCEQIQAQLSDITVASPDALRLIRDADAKAARRP